MFLLGNKPLEQLAEDDLQKLVDTEIESRYIDYKEKIYAPPPDAQLPLEQSERKRVKDRWKIELCNDVSSFANAAGGWIICGVLEDGGIATDVCGLGTNIDIEQEIARLEGAIFSGIEPSIPGLQFQSVTLQDAQKGNVLLIRVPRSYRAPHRVKETQ